VFTRSDWAPGERESTPGTGLDGQSGRVDFLLSLLRCPVCAGELHAAARSIVCGSCAASYPLVGTVPRLAAHLKNGSERQGWLVRVLHAIAAQPSVYDRIQDLAGARELRARVARRLADTNSKTVLDIGAGTGTLAGELPATSTYVWLDSDPRKLDGLLARHKDALAVIADATRMPFRDGAVEYGVCVNVSHHLDDVELERLLAEAARVLRERLVFVDAVSTTRLRARLLWHYDRGERQRSVELLVDAVKAAFDVEEVESFRIHHDYVLITGAPRASRESSC
jgi:SAM-dependent methyltransferase